MEKYKFKNHVYLFGILIILFNSFLYYIFQDWFIKAWTFMTIIGAILGFIEFLSFYYMVDSEKLTKKSLLRKKQQLYFRDVEQIAELSGKKESGFVIGIYGNGVDMRVSHSIKDYKELVKTVVNECKKINSNVSVDVRIEEIINN